MRFLEHLLEPVSGVSNASDFKRGCLLKNEHNQSFFTRTLLAL